MWIVVDVEGRPVRNTYGDVLLYKKFEDAKDVAAELTGRKVQRCFIPRAKIRKKEKV